jgi:HSP20 family protein
LGAPSALAVLVSAEGKRMHSTTNVERRKTMNMRDLIPWGRKNSQLPMLYRDEPASPFLTLHREMNRLFDETIRSFDMPSMFRHTASWPSVEISETDKEYRVSADVPDLEERDVEVLFSDGVLTIRGEKKSEVEDKERQFSERFYGSFERQIPLGDEIEEDKVEAVFKDGVLTVTLPKTAKAQAKVKRIAINGKH